MTKKNDRFCYQYTKVNTCTLLTRVHIYRTNISIIVLLAEFNLQMQQNSD